ncbi:MAG: hypothetical protein ACRD9W_22470, partial [Terriglobia bacterium]
MRTFLRGVLRVDDVPTEYRGRTNLYGDAGGDPVNSSDPFGLCPVCLVAVGVAVAEALPAVEEAAPAVEEEAASIVARGSQLAQNLETSGAVREAGEAAHHIV